MYIDTIVETAFSHSKGHQRERKISTVLLLGKAARQSFRDALLALEQCPIQLFHTYYIHVKCQLEKDRSESMHMCVRLDASCIPGT